MQDNDQNNIEKDKFGTLGSQIKWAKSFKPMAQQEKIPGTNGILGGVSSLHSWIKSQTIIQPTAKMSRIRQEIDAVGFKSKHNNNHTYSNIYFQYSKHYLLIRHLIHLLWFRNQITMYLSA